MAGQNAVGQVGLPRDLSDLINIADAKTTPFCSMVKKGKRLVNGLHEWQVDAFDAPNEEGSIDGKDVDSFENAAENRDTLQNRCMISDRTAKTSTIAEQVNQPAGVKEGEFKRAKWKKLKEIKRDIEVRCLGDRDVVNPSAGQKTGTRGLGSWISNSAQGTYPVPEAYRTPSASIDTTAAGSVDEAKVNTVLQSIFDTVGTNKSYTLFAGTKLVRDIAEITAYDPAGGGAGASIRNYDGEIGTIDMTVNWYKSDFGAVMVVPSTWMAYYDANGDLNSSAIRQGRGYVLDMDDLQIRYNKQPHSQDFEDKGGGPRALIRAIWTLEMGNPLKHGAFKPAP